MEYLNVRGCAVAEILADFEIDIRSCLIPTQAKTIFTKKHRAALATIT